MRMNLTHPVASFDALPLSQKRGETPSTRGGVSKLKYENKLFA